MVLNSLLAYAIPYLAMVGQVPGVEEYIIDADNHKVVEELLEHLIHKYLEDRWGTGKAIWNDKVHIVAGRTNESLLPFIIFSDTNEAIRAPQMQLGEDVGPTDFLESSWDQVKWIREFDRLGIQS